MFRLLAIASVLMSGCMVDGQSADVGAAADALIYGGEVTSDPDIGLLWADQGPCTATLIAPRAILTAAHCFSYRTALSSPEQWMVSFDQGRQTRTVVGFVSFTTSESDHLHDMAVASLDSDVTPQADGIFARALAGEAPRDGNEVMRLFGFGCGDWFYNNGTPTCDRNSSDFSVKRAAEIVWAPFAVDRVLKSEETNQLFQSVQGDSGGPLVNSSGAIVLLTSGTVEFRDSITGPVIATNEYYSDVPMNLGNISRAFRELLIQ